MTSPTTSRPSVWVRVPPPPLFALAVVAGLALQRLLPLPLVPPALEPLARVLAGALLAAGVLFIAWAALTFLRRRTTIVPHRAASSLVVSGPFRLSRNPMYLGLALLVIAASLLAGSAWPVLLGVVPVAILSRRTIPFEEATLERVFGEAYRAYSQRVRRWL